MDDAVKRDLSARSIKHRSEIVACGYAWCGYCLNKIYYTQIKKWVDHGITGVCPKCNIDALISCGTKREAEQYRAVFMSDGYEDDFDG